MFGLKLDKFSLLLTNILDINLHCEQSDLKPMCFQNYSSYFLLAISCKRKVQYMPMNEKITSDTNPPIKVKIFNSLL